MNINQVYLTGRVILMKKNTIKILGIVFLAAFLFITCNPQPSYTPESWGAAGEFTDFRQAFLQTYDMEYDEETDRSLGLSRRSIQPVLYTDPGQAPSLRATVPVTAAPGQDFSDSEQPLEDYPEPGLSTSWTVTPHSTANVYRVVSTTTYPAENTLIGSYIEEYYVKDVTPGYDTIPDNQWTWDDPVVNALGDRDPLHRVRMEIHFRDGSVRYERIVKLYGAGDGFGLFDVEESLDYPAFSLPEAGDAASEYSSVVVYSQQIAGFRDYWFWEGSISGALLGVRYYTEKKDLSGSILTGTSVAYERAIETYVTDGGTLADQLVEVFVGSEHTTLAESVMRKEVVFPLDGSGNVQTSAQSSITKMKTRVVNTSGFGTGDFLISLLNQDDAAFDDWEGIDYHVPSGTTASEIVDDNPAGDVVTLLTNPEGDNLPPIIASQPDSDLTKLYVSILNGFASTSYVPPEQGISSSDLPAAPEGETQVFALPSTSTVASFDGEQGYQVLNSSASADTAGVYNPITEGTVEAWVYVHNHVDFSGIVHKGIAHDFSDEGYTLQFWNRGKVTFGLARQNPSYAYKLTTSNLRLNTGKWYYLAGTWAGGTLTLNIFYDNNRGRTQVYSKSAAYPVGEAYPYPESGPLAIGSQYMEGYGYQGFYGFDGKIYGVVISSWAKDQADLTDYYNANKAKTENW